MPPLRSPPAPRGSGIMMVSNEYHPLIPHRVAILTSPHMQLIEIINQVRANKGRAPLPAIPAEHRLREECELDSLDLAELTVRIEDATGVDVFSDGIVRTIGEIEAKLSR